MKFIPYLTASVLAVLCSCSFFEKEETADVWESQSTERFTSADLDVFELHGNVRNARTTTYYKVDLRDDSLTVDTNKVNISETKIYFDSLGHYVKRKDERIERDSEGRIVKWRDSRPNRRKLHGGFLRDTLTYRHVSDNIIQSRGMGQLATTVYGNDKRIIGQYTAPLSEENGGDRASCFNIYRAEDSRGNWTERLTIWVTQGRTSAPHLSYTLDRREIIYY